MFFMISGRLLKVVKYDFPKRSKKIIKKRQPQMDADVFLSAQLKSP